MQRSYLSLEAPCLRLVAYLMPIVLYPTGSACHADLPQTIEGLAREYESSSRGLRSFYLEGVQATADRRFKRVESSPEEVSSYHYYTNGGHLRCDVATGDKSHSFVVTPQSGFEVRREGEGSYYVVDARMPRSDSFAAILSEAKFMTAPIAIWDREIAGWIRGDLPNEHTKLIRVRERESSGGKQVVATILRDVTFDDGDRIRPQITFVFNRDRMWALEKFVMTGEDGLKYNGEVTYATNDGGPPLVKGVRFWKDELDGSVVLDEEYTVTSITSEPAKPVEDYFSMAAFGFDTSLQGDNARRTNWLFLAVTAATALFLAYLVINRRLAAKARD